jgi:glycosyltransferase involved in cell wall biosynthesis
MRQRDHDASYPLLAAALIARNEEATLPRILDDISGSVDEIIVVDTGSSDGTCAIATTAGAHVVHHTWAADFAAARNAAFAECTALWVMWLDADDRIPPMASNGLRSLKAKLPTLEASAIYVPYRLNFASAGAFGGANNRVRLVRRSEQFLWVGRIHETLYIGDAPALWTSETWVEHRPLVEPDPRKQDRDRRLLDGLLRDGDRSATVLLHYGMLLKDLGEFDAARRLLEECLIICHAPAPRYTALMTSAACCRATGNWGEHIAYLHEAVELNSRRAEAFVGLGDVHAAFGDWQGAMPFFRAALGLIRPELGAYVEAAYSWLPLIGLARCSRALGDDDEARRLLAEAAAVAPERTGDFARIAEEFLGVGSTESARPDASESRPHSAASVAGISAS